MKIARLSLNASTAQTYLNSLFKSRDRIIKKMYTEDLANILAFLTCNKNLGSLETLPVEWWVPVTLIYWKK